MIRAVQIGFIVGALIAINPGLAHAQNRSRLDSPWHPSQRTKTTQTTSGKASFTNDCPLDQTMYATIKKGFGPVDFTVAPHQTVVRSVDRGDKFAVRCGIVVSDRASYDWIQLKQP